MINYSTYYDSFKLYRARSTTDIFFWMRNHVPDFLDATSVVTTWWVHIESEIVIVLIATLGSLLSWSSRKAFASPPVKVDTDIFWHASFWEQTVMPYYL